MEHLFAEGALLLDLGLPKGAERFLCLLTVRSYFLVNLMNTLAQRGIGAVQWRR